MTDSTPQHVGYIVDGNRRWAKIHGLPTYEGHLAGYNAILEVALATFDAGVPYVSAYIFSTENWKRSQDEVGKLMSLILKLLTTDIAILEKNNVRLQILGSKEGVSEKILKAIETAEQRTADNTHGTLAVCFNYGGQLEIAEACKRIVQEGVAADMITLELVGQYMYEPDIPSVDIVVRTSGEQRLSNFMLWRAAYSELLFLEKLWPDMTKDDVTAILKEYTRRDRRIGG
jgi:undecaprenyl diphosphate synthase